MPNELTGRELDAAVAREVMGLEVVETQWGPHYWNGRAKRHSYRTHSMDYDSLHCYSTDANAARLVLQEVERRGLMSDFIDVLESILPLSMCFPEWSYEDAFQILNASPEAICRAALAAARGGKG